jgi:hypothetical protein
VSVLRRSIVEIRGLAGDMSPKGAAWILIEKAGDRYAITGRAQRESIDAFFAPRGAESAEIAIRASVAWADLLGIPLIYVRE